MVLTIKCQIFLYIVKKKNLNALSTGAKRSNQKLLQGRLRAPYRQARPEGWGVHTHCGTPQPTASAPLVGSTPPHRARAREILHY